MKNILKLFFNKFYHLFPSGIILKHQLRTEKKSYNFSNAGLQSFVRSNYIKHLEDKNFLKIYNKVKNFTLIDILRLYELWYLIQQTKKLETGCYIEVGTFRGGSALLIGSALNNFAINNNFYVADTFSGVVKAGIQDNNYKGGEHKFENVNQIKNLLQKNQVKNFKILEGVFPDETSGLIRENLRFIHIDVDTYDSAKDIVNWAYNRLVKNGIIVFDDYGFTGCLGIIKLCEEYEKDDKFIFIHNINGHCILLKK